MHRLITLLIVSFAGISICSAQKTLPHLINESIIRFLDMYDSAMINVKPYQADILIDKSYIEYFIDHSLPKRKAGENIIFFEHTRYTERELRKGFYILMIFPCDLRQDTISIGIKRYELYAKRRFLILGRLTYYSVFSSYGAIKFYYKYSCDDNNWHFIYRSN